MKIEQIKKGMIVKDTWFSFNGKDPWLSGVVVKVLKTRVHIDFKMKAKVVYDKAHLQFLKEHVIK